MSAPDNCKKHNLPFCLFCDADEITRLRAEVEALQTNLTGWLHANGPNGWIEKLRAENEALKKPDCRVCTRVLVCGLRRPDQVDCVNGDKFERDWSTPAMPLWRTEP